VDDEGVGSGDAAGLSAETKPAESRSAKRVFIKAENERSAHGADAWGKMISSGNNTPRTRFGQPTLWMRQNGGYKNQILTHSPNFTPLTTREGLYHDYLAHREDEMTEKRTAPAQEYDPYFSCLTFESHQLGDAGWCPNNPLCPLLIYRSACQGEPEVVAEWFENRFTQNDWPPAWRYTVYDYRHYHSNTHEVVGIYRGQARIRFGDLSGVEIETHAGDAILIPAGVSHQRIRGSRDFHAVGAYPAGFQPDEMRGQPGERPAADDRIAQVPVPAQDPLWGPRGPMRQEWKPT